VCSSDLLWLLTCQTT